MKTYSFIGSDKNAGKTTTLNFVVSKLAQNKICLTSVGLNGESCDNLEQELLKPSVGLRNGNYFITASKHLKQHCGQYQVLHNFALPTFTQDYILGKAINNFDIVLEGPNGKDEILEIKKLLAKNFKIDILLIDGSIDRQFLGHPDISDAFYFALLISKRKKQIQKAKDLLYPLSLPTCEQNRKELEQAAKANLKSLLLGPDGTVLHKGNNIPFLDTDLKEMSLRNSSQKCHLYLDGALSKSLYSFLAPFSNFEITLNNFTLFQNISTDTAFNRNFLPKLSLLHPIKVNKIFLKQESEDHLLELNSPTTVHNIFREELNDIRI